MTVLCKVHRAPFRSPESRWCKGSQPSDTCEVDKRTLPPRRLPGAALMMLGSRANTPGWLDFLIVAKDEGFGIDQPGDHDLSDEEWNEMAMTRVSVLVASFDRLVPPYSGRVTTQEGD